MANPMGFNGLPDFNDRDIITYDDVERKRVQQYDALVLFDAEDIDFVTGIVKTMEGQCGMKLCIKDRDVVCGAHSHDSLIRLIVDRCRRVIVVVSPSFLNSSTNRELPLPQPVLPDIDDADIITYDDVESRREGLPLQQYDAFVLFDNEDIDFVTDIINTMEDKYGTKLCVKDRDVVCGAHSHNSVIKLMVNRCRRVIVVVSPSFLKSPTNKYFYSLASIEGIENQTRKIIPCIYRECPNLPIEFRGYYVLDYRRIGRLFSFWDQLNRALSPSSRREVVPLP